MSLLSVCLITKNEEAVLERSLASIKDIADEIIIVDTGSTDRTKEIALKFTDSVFDFQWIDDFAAARNSSLEKATARWILVLDADEYLSASDASKLLSFLKKESPKDNVVYNLPIINYTGNGLAESNIMESNADRLFPNFNGIRYDRPIHEQLTSTKPGVRLYYKRIPYRIYHTGYLKETLISKNKSTRNMALFNKLKSNGKFEPYDYYTLGNEYQAQQLYSEALDHYKKAFDGAPRNSAWYPHNLIALINTYYRMDRLQESWLLIESELSKYNQYPDYHTLKGLHYEVLGLFHEAEICYKQALQTAERRAEQEHTIWLFSPDYGGRVPLERLSEISLRLNKREDYTMLLTKLLIYQPHDLNVLIKWLEWLVQTEQPSAILKLLGDVYDCAKPSTCMLLFQAALAVGNQELALHFKSLLSPHAQLRDSDRLRLAILNDSQEDWRLIAGCLTPSDLDSNIIRQHLIAAIVWRMPTLQLPTSHEMNSLAAIVEGYALNNPLPSAELLENHSHNLFLLAKDLFLMKQFEAFDQFIAYVSTSPLINHLANYFYHRNQLELAINYYSILYRQDAVSDDSLENLGMLHAAQGLHEDAAEFLTAALEREPGRKHLYYSLIQHVSNDARTALIECFKDRFPQYSELPFIQALK